MKKALILANVSLVTISLAFIGVGYAEIDPRTAVGVWLLDQKSDAVARDSTGNGLDGKIVGGPELIEGRFGGAFSFDGADDSVEIAHGPLLEINDEITMMLWVNGKGQDRWNRVLRKDVGVVGLGIQSYDKKRPILGVKINTDLKIGQAYTTENVLDETWHHVAFALKEGLVRGYKDGERVVEADYLHGAGFGNQENLVIGGFPNFDGALDEVAIFNVALEDEDIEDIVARGLAKAVVSGLAVLPTGKLATVWGAMKVSM